MKKVISLLLSVLMIFSLLSVIPTASATEGYVSGTEVKVTFSLPQVAKFTAVEAMLNYGDGLELVEDSFVIPAVSDAIINTGISNSIYFNASNISSTYDISVDNILCTANFVVTKDLADIDVSIDYNELYLRDGVSLIDLNQQTDVSVDVVYVPPVERTIYFVNSREWDAVYVTLFAEDGTQLQQWPGDAMTLTEDKDVDGSAVYSYTFVGDEYVNCVFNDGVSVQTSNIAVADGQYYDCKGGKWYATLDEVPARATYTVLGDKGICGSDWDPTDVNNDMTYIGKGVYSKVYGNVSAGTYRLKVCESHSDVSFGVDGSGSEVVVEVINEGATVTVAFDANTSKASYTVEGGVEPTEPESTEPETTEPTETEPTEEPTIPSAKGTIVDVDGVLFYYEDGVKTYAGLIYIDGYYYYVTSSAKLVCGTSAYITKTNGLLPTERYNFDEQGRMTDVPGSSPVIKNGIVDENGGRYYYVDNVKTYAGLIYLDGYYYYVTNSAKLVCGTSAYITMTNDLLPAGRYNFDEQGRMIDVPEVTEPEVKNGIVDENGVLYYYVNDVKTYAGLIHLDGYYYYVTNSAKLVCGTSAYITMTNDLLPAGRYNFDEQGRMIDVPEVTEPEVKNGIVEENGVLYYYVDGVKNYAGLIYLDGYYYYVSSSATIVCNKSAYITKTNDLLPAGRYDFDSEGKMVDPPVN